MSRFETSLVCFENEKMEKITIPGKFQGKIQNPSQNPKQE